MRIPHEEVNVDTRFGKAFVIAAGKKDAPVLFVGRKDVMFHSLKTAQRYSSLVPNAKVTVLTEAGHALIGLTDDILAFLRH